MLKALLSGLLMALMVFSVAAYADDDSDDDSKPGAGAGMPDFGNVDVKIEDIKFSGDCVTEARIGNWEDLLAASFNLPKGTIGFGITKCKDGTSAHFLLKETQMDDDESGIHLANLTGFSDGTASDIYGIYGYYKSISAFPFWFWGPPPLSLLPLGTGILGMMKTPKSKPLVWIGMALGADISEHIGAMQVVPHNKRAVERMMKKWHDQPMKQSLTDMHGSYGEEGHTP